MAVNTFELDFRANTQNFLKKLDRVINKVVEVEKRFKNKKIEIRIVGDVSKSLSNVENELKKISNKKISIPVDTGNLKKAPYDINQIKKAANDLKREVKGTTKEFRDFSREARMAGRKLSGSFTRSSTDAERLLSRMRALENSIRTVLAIQGVGKIVNIAGDFDTQLGKIESLLQGSSVSIERYREQLLELSKVSAKNLNDLSEGLYQTLSSGVPAVEGAGGAFEFLATAARAAEAGFTTTKDAVDILSTVINSYAKDGVTAAEASDKLFQTVKLGRTTFTELAKGFGRVSATSREFGISIDESLAAIATITKFIPNTNEAVTAYRSLVLGLVRPSEKAKKLLDQLSLSLAGQPKLYGTAATQGLGLAKTIELINRAAAGNKDIIAQVFPNLRALSGEVFLAAQNGKAFSQALDGIKNSAGANATALDTVQKRFGSAAQRFKSVAQSVFVAIGTEVLPDVTKALSRLGDFLVANQDRFTKFFKALVDVIIRLADAVEENFDLIISAVGLFVAKKTLDGLGSVGLAFNAIRESISNISFATATAGLLGFVKALGTLAVSYAAAKGITFLFGEISGLNDEIEEFEGRVKQLQGELDAIRAETQKKLTDRGFASLDDFKGLQGDVKAGKLLIDIELNADTDSLTPLAQKLRDSLSESGKKAFDEIANSAAAKSAIKNFSRSQIQTVSKAAEGGIEALNMKLERTLEYLRRINDQKLDRISAQMKTLGQQLVIAPDIVKPFITEELQDLAKEYEEVSKRTNESNIKSLAESERLLIKQRQEQEKINKQNERRAKARASAARSRAETLRQIRAEVDLSRKLLTLEQERFRVSQKKASSTIESALPSQAGEEGAIIKESLVQSQIEEEIRFRKEAAKRRIEIAKKEAEAAIVSAKGNAAQIKAIQLKLAAEVSTIQERLNSQLIDLDNKKQASQSRVAEAEKAIGERIVDDKQKQIQTEIESLKIAIERSKLEAKRQGVPPSVEEELKLRKEIAKKQIESIDLDLKSGKITKGQAKNLKDRVQLDLDTKVDELDPGVAESINEVSAASEILDGSIKALGEAFDAGIESAMSLGTSILSIPFSAVGFAVDIVTSKLGDLSGALSSAFEFSATRNTRQDISRSSLEARKSARDRLSQARERDTSLRGRERLSARREVGAQTAEDLSNVLREVAEQSGSDIDVNRFVGSTGSDIQRLTQRGDFEGASKLFNETVKRFEKQVAGSEQQILQNKLLSGVSDIFADLNYFAENFASTLGVFVDKIVELALKFISTLVEQAPEIINSIFDALDQLLPIIASLIPKLIPLLFQFLNQFIENLPDYILIFVNAIIDALPAIIEGVINLIPTLIVAFIRFMPMLYIALGRAIFVITKTLFSPAFWNRVGQNLVAQFAKVWKPISKFGDELFSKLGKVFKNIGNFFTSIFRKIRDFFTGGISSIGSGFKKAWNWTKSLFANGGISPSTGDHRTAAAWASIGAQRFAVGGIAQPVSRQISRAVGALGQDSVPALLTPQEVVLNPQAVSNLGGPQSANLLNQGSTPQMMSSSNTSIIIEADDEATRSLLNMLVKEVKFSIEQPGGIIKNSLNSQANDMIPYGTRRFRS